MIFCQESILQQKVTVDEEEQEAVEGEAEEGQEVEGEGEEEGEGVIRITQHKKIRKRLMMKRV